MNEERRIRLSRKLQELAEKEGISFKDLLEKARLAGLVLKFWGEEGEKKKPEEVLRADLAELLKEVRHLMGSP